MAINTIILNQGIGKAIQAQNNSGYRISLTSFGISEQSGDFSKNRTTPNTVWFKDVITNTIKIDDNSIELTCYVPPNAFDRTTNTSVVGSKVVKEVYIYGLDENLDEYIFAIGQPDVLETYSNTGAYEFRVQLILQNVTVDSVYNFIYSQAQEIDLHNESNVAHPNLFWNVLNVTEDMEAIANRVHLVKHPLSVDTITIKLPQPQMGRKVAIKDTIGSPFLKKTFIVSNDGELIDNALQYQLTAFESLSVISDGTNWFTVWSGGGGGGALSGVFEIGNPFLDGSWRIRVDAGRLVFERGNGNGLYTIKDIME
jgi:hypothetical protein